MSAGINKQNILYKVGERIVITGGERNIDCIVIDDTITMCIVVRDIATGDTYYITWDDPAKFLKEVGVSKK